MPTMMVILALSIRFLFLIQQKPTEFKHRRIVFMHHKQSEDENVKSQLDQKP